MTPRTRTKWVVGILGGCALVAVGWGPVADSFPVGGHGGTQTLLVDGLPLSFPNIGPFAQVTREGQYQALFSIQDRIFTVQVRPLDGTGNYASWYDPTINVNITRVEWRKTSDSSAEPVLVCPVDQNNIVDCSIDALQFLDLAAGRFSFHLAIIGDTDEGPDRQIGGFGYDVRFDPETSWSGTPDDSTELTSEGGEDPTTIGD